MSLLQWSQSEREAGYRLVVPPAPRVRSEDLCAACTPHKKMCCGERDVAAAGVKMMAARLAREVLEWRERAESASTMQSATPTLFSDLPFDVLQMLACSLGTQGGVQTEMRCLMACRLTCKAASEAARAPLARLQARVLRSNVQFLSLDAAMPDAATLLRDTLFESSSRAAERECLKRLVNQATPPEGFVLAARAARIDLQQRVRSAVLRVCAETKCGKKQMRLLQAGRLGSRCAVLEIGIEVARALVRVGSYSSRETFATVHFHFILKCMQDEARKNTLL